MMPRPCVTCACLMRELLSEERARRVNFARALLVLRYSCFTLDAVRMLGSCSSDTHGLSVARGARVRRASFVRALL